MKKVISAITAVLVLASITGLAQARGARRPANDDLAAASAISALPFAEAVNLKGATLEPEEVQPSCRSIGGSVWFGFSVAEAEKVVAELSSTFRSTVAVFEQTEEGLVEVACGVDNASEPTEFDAAPARAYLVQLGSAGARQGVVDLRLGLSHWREKTIYSYDYELKRDEQRFPLLRVTGAPRESDPTMYDITIGISEQQPVKRGFLTFGLVTTHVQAELLRIPASATHVTVDVSGRYDSSQYTCAADDGAGTCTAGAPLKDLNWLTGGDSSRAELVITLRAEKDGNVLQERTITIPYAGQGTGLIP